MPGELTERASLCACLCAQAIAEPRWMYTSVRASDRHLTILKLASENLRRECADIASLGARALMEQS